MDQDHKNYTDWDTNEEGVYQLRLFVAGTSLLSVRAINNLKVTLEEHLEGKYELDIIDVYQQPEIALQEDISVVPMLVKMIPLPYRRLIGDMSDTSKVLRGLGI